MSCLIGTEKLMVDVQQIGGYSIQIGAGEGSIGGRIMLPDGNRFKDLLQMHDSARVVDFLINRMRLSPDGQAAYCPMDQIGRIVDVNHYRPPLILTGAELCLKDNSYFEGAVQSIALLEGQRKILSMGGGIEGQFDFGLAGPPEFIFVLWGEIEFNGVIYTPESPVCQIAHGEQIHARFTGKPALYLCWYGGYCVAVRQQSGSK